MVSFYRALVIPQLSSIFLLVLRSLLSLAELLWFTLKLARRTVFHRQEPRCIPGSIMQPLAGNYRLECRFSSRSFRDFLLDLSHEQKQIVIDAGLGPTLSYPYYPRVDRKLYAWLLASLDTERMVLQVAVGTEIPVTAESVRRILGLPMGPKPVTGENVMQRTQSQIEVASIFDMPNTSRLLLTMSKRQFMYRSNACRTEFEKNCFICSYIAVLVCSTLSPRTRNDRALSNVFPALLHPSKIRDFNWCQFVVDDIRESAYIAKNSIMTGRGTINLFGCLLFLQVLYLDSLMLSRGYHLGQSYPLCADYTHQIIEEIFKIPLLDTSLEHYRAFSMLMGSNYAKLVPSSSDSTLKGNKKQKRRVDPAVAKQVENILISQGLHPERALHVIKNSNWSIVEITDDEDESSFSAGSCSQVAGCTSRTEDTQNPSLPVHTVPTELSENMQGAITVYTGPGSSGPFGGIVADCCSAFVTLVPSKYDTSGSLSCLSRQIGSVYVVSLATRSMCQECRDLVDWILSNKDNFDYYNTWISHDEHRSIQVSGMALRKQFFLKLELDEDMCELAMRTFRYEVIQNEPMNKISRHFISPDWAKMVIAGAKPDKDCCLQKFFKSEHIPYDVSTCQLLVTVLEDDGMYACYVWDIVSRRVTVFDPMANASSPVDDIFQKHKHHNFHMLPTLMSCMRLYFGKDIGCSLDWETILLTGPIPPSIRGWTALCSLFFAYEFNGVDLCSAMSEDSVVRFRNNLLWSMMNLPGNRSALPLVLQKPA
ncbi:hypothetical protein ACP70R_036644 [Stipagrostis hirtigluma subsp. patula]